MRISKPTFVVGAVVALAFSTVAVAGALITGSGGQVVRLTAPPTSVAVDAFENATALVTFDERQGVTLAAPVLVDAVDPGTYAKFPNGSRTIPAGTEVDSHFVHNDLPKGATGRRVGSITFSSDILGVIGATGRLNKSDGLGASGTTYAGTTRDRGLESASGAKDVITISDDRRTLSVDVRTTGVIDDIRVITRHVDLLTTTILDTPDPVTAGNDVQYTLIVTNVGSAPTADAHVVDTLPAGTTLVTASAPDGCTGSGPVDCSLGTIAVGATAVATIVVTSPATVPDGGTMTNSAIASPGANNLATTEPTTVEEPTPEESKGFVIPGGTIETGGDDPAEVRLPNTGPGAPILITQGPGTFCAGPCTGTTTTISAFPGYDDPENPIHLTLTYTFPEVDGDPNASLTEAATAFGATIYKNETPEDDSAGAPVPWCDSPGSGVATPHPCLDARSIVQSPTNTFTVTFEIVYLSGDPRFGRR
jgi:uncharacterized repeat protein (TIGR01451 family)